MEAAGIEPAQRFGRQDLVPQAPAPPHTPGLSCVRCESSDRGAMPLAHVVRGLGAVESVAKAPVGRLGVVHCPDYGLGSVAGNLDVDLVTEKASVAPGEAAG